MLLALRQSERLTAWNALTPGKRRGLIAPIEAAARPETRAKRIAALLRAL
ncbi:YdeI/OmpD-associated family protein [Sulfitobacter albidus]|uniref:YdeI/OmpD-associated family protein n=1 Tax=Sulfitobacter albidus TaxID=2829501 RepID=A0A975JCW1_9RHOB|nr:YdeI/OmpD-associated family protein [Sulfitobacter albidus]QUJ75765.1 YdeI/OmpD-associated family protein [Sulfitobacter albidus]